MLGGQLPPLILKIWCLCVKFLLQNKKYIHLLATPLLVNLFTSVISAPLSQIPSSALGDAWATRMYKIS